MYLCPNLKVFITILLFAIFLSLFFRKTIMELSSCNQWVDGFFLDLNKSFVNKLNFKGIARNL